MQSLTSFCLVLLLGPVIATKLSLYYPDLESARESYLSIGGELEREYLKGRKPLLSFFSGPTSRMLELYSLASGLIENASWEEVRQGRKKYMLFLWLCLENRHQNTFNPLLLFLFIFLFSEFHFHKIF